MFKPSQGFRLEIHLLKSHAASYLNRDGAGRLKTIDIGGVRRLRVSSQAQKNAERKSSIFIQFLAEAEYKYGATQMIRTRHAMECVKMLIHATLLKNGHSPEKYKDQINTALLSLPHLFSNKTDETDTATTTQLISFSQKEVEHIAEAMTVFSNDKVEIRDCESTVKLMHKERDSVGPLSPELQLFGRFTTTSSFLKNIDTPLQVAHGFTVHEAKNEKDYWTAADDLNFMLDQDGNAHISNRSIGAGIFYHYYCLDVPLLSHNIASSFVTLDTNQQTELTKDLISAFLYSALTVNPLGGQTGHANHDLPSIAYITYGSAFPYSAQAAFECPVLPDRTGGYMRATKERFEQWRTERKNRYGIFSGQEFGFGLSDLNLDLQQLIERAITKAVPAINRGLAA